MYPNGQRPPSAVPLGLGVMGAGVAAGAFLVGAVMTIIAHRDGGEFSRDDTIGTVLVVETGVVTGLLLVFALGLILLGRDAGRSGTVWIGVAALPWTLILPVTLASLADSESHPAGFRTLATVTALVCGGATLFGLTVAMVALGIPPGRRWLAERVLARPEPGWPSAPIVAAGRRFVLSAVFGVGGCAALLVLTPLATTGSDGSLAAMITWTVVLVLFVALPQALGLWGARLARRGRRGGANLARAAGVFVVYGLEIFMVLGVWDAMAGVAEDAVLPGPVTLVLAVLLTCVVVLALVQWVAGLAALADPRSERFMRSGGLTPVQ
ncbi:hypothetical protein GCM10009557_27020 [Virgisporangium ochraceum]|uniref:Uncharacterized protein n=1 Tax=Virgisporangium ochraceum TaxID=65505 RepID=A0A8J3ZY82_9ACTN|nr:hypothetical protein [Virgisporangium ochraceum]GIJ69650.1 hypothetical protein Voc01_045670 [Virgisporangium ochraceum]